MKNVINSIITLTKLFFSALFLAFFVASAITYFITSIKFALFLASCCIFPVGIILLYWFDKWNREAI